MNEIITITGTGVPLLLDDIDTDRIIPARFLRCVTFDGLGEHAFEDDRQQDADHPFNQPQFQNGSVLVAGRNFGCGSSREHAPQSLMRWGIQAIVAESFAEIFFGNCTALGIPAVCTSRANLEKLEEIVKENPDAEITLDLNSKTICQGDWSFAVTIPDSASDALTTGKWDFMAQLLQTDTQIGECAATIPYLNGF